MAEPPLLTAAEAEAWFRAQVPDWFTDVSVLVDRDEIMVVGTLEPPASDRSAGDTGDADSGSAAEAPDGEAERIEIDAIADFRERTRDQRVAIAQRAEAKFQRKVAWATRCGSTSAPFTHLSIPVMTRLRIDERQVLDTLVAAGVARSRSDAVVWCVRHVATSEKEWLDELRQAVSTVDDVRAKGPG